MDHWVSPFPPSSRRAGVLRRIRRFHDPDVCIDNTEYPQASLSSSDDLAQVCPELTRTVCAARTSLADGYFGDFFFRLTSLSPFCASAWTVPCGFSIRLTFRERSVRQ